MLPEFLIWHSRCQNNNAILLTHCVLNEFIYVLYRIVIVSYFLVLKFLNYYWELNNNRDALDAWWCLHLLFSAFLPLKYYENIFLVHLTTCPKMFGHRPSNNNNERWYAVSLMLCCYLIALFSFSMNAIFRIRCTNSGVTSK